MAAPLASDSKKVPYGSVFCRRAPSTRDVISNLYRSPSPTFGTNVSQMPLTPRLRIGCEAGFQPLKSPMTLTCSAFGAQTAKCTPGTPSTLAAVRAKLLVRAMQRAFVEQVQIEFGEHALSPPLP